MMRTRPRAGERYAVRLPFCTHVLVQWRAPLTTGAEKVLPEGLEFVVAIDPPEHATAVAADPIRREQWEESLVAEEDRTADKYDGYYLVIDFDDLVANCVRLEP